MSAMSAWMKDKDLPKNAQARIRAYFIHKFKNKVYFNEQEMLAELPPSMSNQIAEHMYGSILRECPLFRGLGTSVLNKVARQVVPSTCMKGQVIFEQGQIGTEMYCVIKGEVEVIQDGEQLGFLPEGSFFGESALIDDGEGSEIRARTVKAMTECELCFLRRDDLETLRRECPELMIKLRRFARMGEKVRPTRRDDVGNPRILHALTMLTNDMALMHRRLDLAGIASIHPETSDDGPPDDERPCSASPAAGLGGGNSPRLDEVAEVALALRPEVLVEQQPTNRGGTPTSSSRRRRP